MPRAIKNAGALLRSSVVFVFYVPGLTTGDNIVELCSQISGIKKSRTIEAVGNALLSEARWGKLL